MLDINTLISSIKKLQQYQGIHDWVEDGVLSSTSPSAPHGEEDDLIDLLNVIETEASDLLLDFGKVVNQTLKDKLAKHKLQLLRDTGGVWIACDTFKINLQ